MTPPPAGNSEDNLKKLPRRDWILLPALSLVTICLLIGVTELIARKLFPKTKTFGENCIVFNDPTTGTRGIPHCVCWEKLPDTALTEYRFNSRGDRDDVDLKPKPPGTYRIVMVGASFATGMRVPIEKTFATMLPPELSRRTGRRVELYNEGLPWRPPFVIAAHMDEVLAAQPDMILWTLTPSDIGDVSRLTPHPVVSDDAGSNASAGSERGRLLAILGRVEGAVVPERVEAFVHDQWQEKRTAVLMRELLYESPSQYVKAFLMREPDAEFLRSQPTPQWATYLQQFETSATTIEGQARAAGVPVVAVLLPDRAQVAMISMGTWPAGFDPYKLDNELRPIILRHGGIYLDILQDFRSLHDPERDYYPLDGHPNANGHALFTAMLANALTRGSVPALEPLQRAALTQGK